MISNHLILAICWISYGALHSLLASYWLKKRLISWPKVQRHYRLLYNLLAVLLILIPIYLTLTLPSISLWQWQGWLAVVSHSLAAMALLGFLYTLKFYDMQAFLGLRQSDSMPFTLSPLHRFVRHPWYLLALVVIWSRDMNSTWLVTSCAITAYFFIGARLEEKKLKQELGKRYQRYCERVPAILPWPGRYLTKRQAQELMRQ